jgi:hypothetical protein
VIKQAADHLLAATAADNPESQPMIAPRAILTLSRQRSRLDASQR